MTRTSSMRKIGVGGVKDGNGEAKGIGGVSRGREDNVFKEGDIILENVTFR